MTTPLLSPGARVPTLLLATHHGLCPLYPAGASPLAHLFFNQSFCLVLAAGLPQSCRQQRHLRAELVAIRTTGNAPPPSTHTVLSMGILLMMLCGVGLLLYLSMWCGSLPVP